MAEVEIVKCGDCEEEVDKRDAIYDSEQESWCCEKHFKGNLTGYCSLYCQRTHICDGSC